MFYTSWFCTMLASCYTGHDSGKGRNDAVDVTHRLRHASSSIPRNLVRHIKCHDVTVSNKHPL